MKIILKGMLTFIVIFIAGLFIGIAKADAPIETVDQKYQRELSVWVDKLAKKENCGHPGIIDVNGKWSRGDFCFQDGTYISYSKKYKEEDQKKLVIAMITDEYKNWRHWQCSTIGCEKYGIIGIGLPPVYPQ